MRLTVTHDHLRRLAARYNPARRVGTLGAAGLGVGEAAERLGVSRRQVLQGVAELENLPYLDLAGVTPTAGALAAMTEMMARRHGVVPLFLNDCELTVATSSPRDIVFEELRRALPLLDLVFVLADEAEILALAEEVYPSASEIAVGAVIAAGGLPHAIRDAARVAGCESIWRAGLREVLRGHTSLDELVRVVGAPE